MKGNNRNYALIAAVAAVIIISSAVACIFLAVKNRQPPAPEETPEIIEAAGTEHGYSESTAPEDNPNSAMEISSVYDDSVILTEDGRPVPDIMSAAVMKSNYRKFYSSFNDEPRTAYASGPRIVINGYAVPDTGFFAEYNDVSKTAEYKICAACLRSAGLTPNSDISFTCYDYAMSRTAHDRWVSADELELHTTWTLISYDADTGTYSFRVEQDGPFSGTSDIFSVYRGGIRCNTMPARGAAIGTQYVPYDCLNCYWTNYDMSRNELRMRANEILYTKYGRLGYDGDPKGMTLDEWLQNFGGLYEGTD